MRQSCRRSGGARLWGRVGVAREQHELPLPGGVADREQWAACGASELMIIVWRAWRLSQSWPTGELSCSSCAGVLVPWGYARARSVRGCSGLVRVRPRRTAAATARRPMWCCRPGSCRAGR
jgi:hypothetical protein